MSKKNYFLKGLLTSYLLFTLYPFSVLATENIIFSFEFENKNEWKCNKSITGLKIENDCLIGECIGDDPQLFSPIFEIKANNLQIVEIKMKSNKEGNAELFWSGTLEEPYMGFRPNKKEIFYVKGDNKFHIYRLFPFWASEDRVIHLRIDPPDGSTFSIDYIRIIEISPLSKGNWTVLGGLEIKNYSEKILQFTIKNEKGAIFLPLSPFQAYKTPFISFYLKINGDNNSYGEIIYNENEIKKNFSFDLTVDGKIHYYNIFPGWKGNVSNVVLLLNNCEGEGEIGEICVSSKPIGVELEIKYFGVDGIGRVNKEFKILLLVKNRGEILDKVRAEILLPEDIKILKGENPQEIKDISYNDVKFFEWIAICNKIGEFKILAKLYYKNFINEVSSTIKVNKLPSIPLSNYPPPPQKPKSDWEIGAYYFPGWYDANCWSPIKNWGRKPLLGYYKEGSPVVMDWQIKWALEHGITFFIFDWYWIEGQRKLEHALNDGFLKSTYGKFMKFALLWANHNPPQTNSISDLLNLTQYCIEKYFHLPNYLRIENKPVLFIFNPRGLTQDLGSEKVKEAFSEMRKLCEKEGLNGLFIVGCMGNKERELKIMKSEGYDAITGYTFPSAGILGDIKRDPYENMVRGFCEIWDGIVRKGFDYIVPVPSGWDPRPWHGSNTLVRTNLNPYTFEKALILAKEFVEKNKLRKIIVIEAWNEWGEGSYIEPSREWGFSFLDIVKKIFAKEDEIHEDIVPEDIGLKVIEADHLPFNDKLEFNENLKNFVNFHNIKDLKVENNTLKFKTISYDSHIQYSNISFDTKEYKKLIVKMKVDKGSIGRVFWASDIFPSISPFTGCIFKIFPDNEIHLYEIDLTSNLGWQGKVTHLRLDPTDACEANVAIEYIRFLK